MKTSMEAAAEAWGGPADTVVAGAAGNFLCPAKDMTPNGFKVHRVVVVVVPYGSRCRLHPSCYRQ